MTCIVYYTSLFLAVSFLLDILSYVQSRTSIKMSSKVSQKLHLDSFKKLCRVPISYYFEKGEAEIINSISADISNIISGVEAISILSISAILQMIGGELGYLY